MVLLFSHQGAHIARRHDASAVQDHLLEWYAQMLQPLTKLKRLTPQFDRAATCARVQRLRLDARVFVCLCVRTC